MLPGAVGEPVGRDSHLRESDGSSVGVTEETTVQNRGGARVVWALLAATLLGACSPSPVTAPPSVPETTPVDPVQPAVVSFEAGSTPVWTSDDVWAWPPTAAVLGDRILLDSGALDAEVLDAGSGDPVWELRARTSPIGQGVVESVPLMPSSAAGGLLAAAYTQQCRAENPCADGGEGTRKVLGVAGLAIADGTPLWQSVVATVGPPGSPTELDLYSLDVTVVDADDTGVLVRVGTFDGRPTSAGDPAFTAVLLDAATGAEQWRLPAFDPGHLTDGVVYGTFTSGQSAQLTAEAAVDRTTGKRIELGLAGPVRVHGAGGPGALVGRSSSVAPVGNLTVLGRATAPVATVTDGLSYAAAPCADLDGLVCIVQDRRTDTHLLSWLAGEPAPTTAALWQAQLQVAATAGDDVLLVNENPFLTVDDPEILDTWFAVRRDGTVIGERRPGVVLAASDRWVVTVDRAPDDASGQRRFALQVWAVG